MHKNHEDPPRTNHKIWQHAQFSALICSPQNNCKDAEIVKIKQVKRESCATLLNLIAHTETVPGFFTTINLSAILKVHHHCLSEAVLFNWKYNPLIFTDTDTLISPTLQYTSASQSYFKSCAKCWSGVVSLDRRGCCLPCN